MCCTKAALRAPAGRDGLLCTLPCVQFPVLTDFLSPVRNSLTSGYNAELIGDYVTKEKNMNKRKLLTALATIGLLLLWAGAALAANSGIAAIDTPLNTMGTVIKAGGDGVGAVGTIGVIHHIRSGSWLGMLEHLGLTVVGSSAVINYSAYAAA